MIICILFLYDLMSICSLTIDIVIWYFCCMHWSSLNWKLKFNLKLRRMEGEIVCHVLHCGFLTGRQFDSPLSLSPILATQSLMRSRHLQRYSILQSNIPNLALSCTACQHACVCEVHLVITMCCFNSVFCHKSASVTLVHRQWSKLSFSICLSLWIKRIRAVLDISFHLCKYMQISRCYERIGHDPEQLVFLKG